MVCLGFKPMAAGSLLPYLFDSKQALAGVGE